MGNKSGTLDQIISLPKGGGALHGIGEKFSPDLHTGTGNFTVPIALPPGRNGFQPQLSLVYSTGNGNGLFGLGWNLSVPGVTRKTSKGIPRYRDYHKELKERDTFILSGAEDLVPIDDGNLDPKKATRYRPRTEGLFAKIIHHHDAQAKKNFWEVCSKDGLVSYYGTSPDNSPTYPTAFQAKDDPAAITNPNDPSRVFSWKLTLTKDPFNNRIEYLYDERDKSLPEGKDGHLWDQPLLKHIRYVDYKREETSKFLVHVVFEYEDRPDDPFSDYRAGFEIRTTKCCKSILIETHADRDYKVRKYDFTYAYSSLNTVSLLRAIDVVGFDDRGTKVRELPPLEFGYTDFNPQDQKRRDFYPVQGADLPSASLANSSMELVDLFGNGLPDVLEMNGTVRYWRNRGNGRFDLPRPMGEAPAGLALASVGVQLIDANGDGRADLLVTQGALSGYYPLQFGGLWDRRSFHKYQYAPSFDLKDPEVRLMDLTGDGVTDVLRSGTRLKCFFNDPHEGWSPHNTKWVERQSIDVFPNVNFSDSRVKLADMTGDGMQDIVLVYDGNVEYWSNLGYGNWGQRLHMKNSPRFPYGYDPKRILLGDVDGDGLADIIYVDDRKVILWINQSGNRWSDPIEILGTPPVSDMDGVRLADLLGSGISGVLWTRDVALDLRAHYFFLDLTGGTKPYLLHEMNNNMGALTRVGYAPSTRYYLDDQKRPETRWKTTLPFPVQVVSHVEVIDEISKGKLTTKYKYHHGYWDGAEREFRGFGMVEQFDTEIIEEYNKSGLHGETAIFEKVETHFSPPTLTKTWFHQGPIGEEFGDWKEQDWSDQYWKGDPQLLKHTESVNDFLKSLSVRRVKRDALRTLRGSILRTELYALDGTSREDRPYTVTEHAYNLREEQPPTDPKDKDRPRIFFPHSTTQRTTQWERGDDPMTQFSFSGKYDEFGQPLSQTSIAMPRRRSKRIRLSSTNIADEKGMLVTHARTAYAEPTASSYIYDRTAYATSFTLSVKPEVTETPQGDVIAVLQDQKEAASEVHQQIETALESWKPEQGEPSEYRIIGHAVNSYDGPAYTGKPIGKLENYGAPTRSESLVFTDDILDNAYASLRPGYLGGSATLPAGAPANFGANHGYIKKTSSTGYVPGYYVVSKQQKYDFQDSSITKPRGLVLAMRDPLGNESKVTVYAYDLLPLSVKDPIGLEIKAEYNYRVLQPFKVIEPNGNFSIVKFSPLGLVTATWVKGKNGEGDQTHPSARLEYDFLAFANSKSIDPDNPEPVYVHTIRRCHHDTEIGVDPGELNRTIESREYSDGFGRLIQTRTQGEEVRFGDSTLGGGEAVLPAMQDDGSGGAITGQENPSESDLNVVVSGWQIFDNKGRVVEKYEPFFDEGWEFQHKDDAMKGEHASMYYDPRGQVISTENPDGSEQRVIYGVPVTLENPLSFKPTPWEAYTYDANDNAGRTHPSESNSYRHHFNTPASILIDAMGRTLMAIERNRANPSTTNPSPVIEEYRTRSTFDIQGNLITVTDTLDREAFTHDYDLAKRPLKIHSIDAGDRWMVPNAANSEIERQDSKGALTLRAFDKLNRPKFVWARNNVSASALTLRERLIYGDNPASVSRLTATEVAKGNLLGKLYKYYDEAGLLTLAAYDFKGNPLEKQREVIADSEILATLSTISGTAKTFVVDWNAPPGLEGKFQTSIAYDALNRVKSMKYPKDVDGNRKALTPFYNHAGALESVKLDAETYVERIAYNAKGQRILIAYGNGIMTRYAYDTKTFRLMRMRTEKFSTQLSTPLTYTPSGGLLQDFAYEYDLSGNILKITDQSPESGLPAQPGQLERFFTYDPLYRLLSATGRECDLPAPPSPAKGPWDDEIKCQDPTKVRWYTQTYAYDPAGNMQSMHHETTPGNSFNRDFIVASANNRLDTVTDRGTPRHYLYDNNGNLIKENTERHFAWDHSDRMIAFANQTTATSPRSVEACYLYDAGGQRVKKFTRNQQLQVEATVYIDGIFEHHLSDGQENNTLHVMDNQSRIAMVRVGDAFSDDGAPNITVKYQLGDHLGSSNIVIGGNDATGNTFINREEYFPYGETCFGSFGRKRYRFTGKERDEESGLYYHGARYYAPWLTRWVSCDPAGMVDGVNMFRYVGSDPMSSTDTTGMQREKIQGQAVSGVNSAPASSVKAGREASSPSTPDMLLIAPGMPQNKYPGTISVSPDLISALGDLQQDKAVPGDSTKTKVMERSAIITKTGRLLPITKEEHINALGEGDWSKGVQKAEGSSPGVKKTREIILGRESDPTVQLTEIAVHTHPNLAAPSDTDTGLVASTRGVFNSPKRIVVGTDTIYLQIPTKETFALRDALAKQGASIKDEAKSAFADFSAGKQQPNEGPGEFLKRGVEGGSKAAMAAVKLVVYQYSKTNQRFERVTLK